MRLALPAVFALGLAGCIIQTESDNTQYDGGGGWGSGWGGSGGSTGFGCHADADCGGGGLVCTRNGECLSASSVRIVHVDWTVRSQPASGMSCTTAPNLAITFVSTPGDEFGFAPVPCDAGRFTVDKLPMRFGSVQLAREGDYAGGARGTFDSEGNAVLDLPY